MKKTKQTAGVSLEVIWKWRLSLRAEGDKLRAEGAKLRAEGDKLWAEGVIAVHGNISIKWLYREKKDSYACKLETGEVFEP